MVIPFRNLMYASDKLLLVGSFNVLVGLKDNTLG